MPDLELLLRSARPDWPTPPDGLEARILSSLSAPAQGTAPRGWMNRGLCSSRPNRRVVTITATLVTVALLGVLLTVKGTHTTTVLPGDLRVVERAAAAVKPSGEIEHVKSVVDGVQYEYWSLSGSSSRTIVTDARGRTSEYTAGPVCSILAQPPRSRSGCVSTGAALSSALSSGEARVVGDGAVGGRPVKRIAFRVAASGASGTYEVDAASMEPVRLTVRTAQGAIVVETYRVFRYLGGTPENKALAGVPSAP